MRLADSSGISRRIAIGRLWDVAGQMAAASDPIAVSVLRGKKHQPAAALSVAGDAENPEAADQLNDSALPGGKPASQATAEETKPKGKTGLFGLIVWIALGVAALVAALGFALSLFQIPSFSGLTDGTFVGVENFRRLLKNGNFLTMLKNSALLRLIQLAAGTVLALPLIAWVKIGKKPGRTLTKAFLCLAPYCLPYIISVFAVIRVLPREMMLSANGGYMMYTLSTVLQTAGFIAFCGGFFAYLSMRGIGNGAFQGVLVALLISGLTLLTCENGTLVMVSNGANRAVTNTFDQFAYQQMANRFEINQSNAASVVKVALQALLGAGAALLLCRVAKKDETRTEIPDAQGSILTFTTAKLIWLAILMVLAALSFGIEVIARQPEESAQAFVTAAQEMTRDGLVMNGAMISLVVAGLGGALGGLVAYSFMVYFRSGRKGFGLAMLIAASSLSFLSMQFLGARQLGFYNTVWPMILRQVFDPRLVSLMIALAVVLRMAPERRTGWILAGLTCFAMAFAWGDFYGAHLFVASSSHAPLASYLYRLIMNGAMIQRGSLPQDALAQQAMTPAISLLTSLPALMLGFGGAACCIRGFKDAR